MERLKNEDFEDYRARRKAHQNEIKIFLKGKLRPNNGTIIKPKAKKKLSFTEKLRNSKGYNLYLAKVRRFPTKINI